MEKQTSRSLFWPVILIGAGVIWLLGTLGIIPGENFAALGSLWPLILIAIGLDLLFGHRSPLGGAIVGLITVGLVIFFLIAGPSLVPDSASMLKTEYISAEIGQSVSADIRLDFAAQPVTITALDDSTSLLEGEIDHYGTLRFADTGLQNRRIALQQFNNNPWSLQLNPNAAWEIELTPLLPLDPTISGASGSADLDLSELQLKGFEIDQGSGQLTLWLPPSSEEYIARIEGGSGSLDLFLPADGDLIVNLDGGSGSINIEIPPQAAAQLTVRSAGSGSVNVPSWLERQQGGSDSKEGVWKTEGFDQAAHKLTIICDDLGSGSFTIH